jgi:predicted site-specific integrase-resolvase
VVKDIISIMTCFSARIYGKRAKVKKLIEGALNENDS